MHTQFSPVCVLSSGTGSRGGLSPLACRERFTMERERSGWLPGVPGVPGVPGALPGGKATGASGVTGVSGTGVSSRLSEDPPSSASGSGIWSVSLRGPSCCSSTLSPAQKRATSLPARTCDVTVVTTGDFFSVCSALGCAQHSSTHNLLWQPIEKTRQEWAKLLCHGGFKFENKTTQACAYLVAPSHGTGCRTGRCLSDRPRLAGRRCRCSNRPSEPVKRNTRLRKMCIKLTNIRLNARLAERTQNVIALKAPSIPGLD